ncbi:MAG: hypothetical protein N2445_02095 [Acidobacteria bacterium]|nr:hypothetical protein [Acidobacteriota bacterium]
MPVKGGKIYAELSQNLEKMADGVDKHSGEQDFPSILKKADLRETRKKLEDLSEKYEKILTDARIAYEKYSELVKEVKKDYSKFKTTLEGFYGKKSPVLLDFGLTPWKTGAKKKEEKKKS